MSRLVVVSNRIAPPDEHAASAGGLAVGILGALKAAGGTVVWLEWRNRE
ncbi:trehalose-6-phosphate synthase [Escherichia coli]|uniref:Trehalose-6-phosphate synthase n=1 Tax=Escherichia coli TaxID=562 RepID=A0A376S814_ECOLX|nr:trehalose-6-phosphate synthase [Escherichia coli]